MTLVTQTVPRYLGCIKPPQKTRSEILRAIRELAQAKRRARTRGGLVIVLSYGDLYEQLMFSRRQIDDAVVHHHNDLKRSRIRIA
jgi:hypothetical protein